MENINETKIKTILEKQKIFRNTFALQNIEYRKKALIKLKSVIIKYEKEILDALYKDLHKSSFEGYTTEVGYSLSSISNAIKNLNKWAKPEKISVPLHLMPSKDYIYSEPYGSVLIIGPYNYPFQLIIEPLIGAIAAGNTAVVKPSELSPSTSAILHKLISEAFEEEYICCIEGGVETNISLTNSKFDYIFFTGSVNVGKEVMKAASNNLIPVTLELGGKSPVIVDSSANIKNAAKRIIWGKTINAGQTCIAPDYILVHENVKEELIYEMKKAVKEFYGDNVESSSDLGRMVNLRHFDRVKSMIDIDNKDIISGGKTNRDSLYIEPTLINASWESACMQEEIFGPVLPIMSYKDIDLVIEDINSREKPLALYVFAEDKKLTSKILKSISSGGACVNDTIMHIVNSNLPFGGVGNSGIGSYHGKYSFDTFSHKKAVSVKKSKFNLSLMLPPYSESRFGLIKKILR
ncbi:MAG: aldehyde dehydrogenase [Clostridium sp.]|nr:aldehyde dehydrogenase [Clostridium sp.]